MNNNNVKYCVRQLVFNEDTLLADNEGKRLYNSIEDAKEFIAFAKIMDKHLLPGLNVYYVIEVLCNEENFRKI